jgi:hypothetical protein
LNRQKAVKDENYRQILANVNNKLCKTWHDWRRVELTTNLC